MVKHVDANQTVVDICCKSLHRMDDTLEFQKKLVEYVNWKIVSEASVKHYLESIFVYMDSDSSAFYSRVSFTVPYGFLNFVNYLVLVWRRFFVSGGDE